MPKGCLLHLHIEDSINVEWISKIVNENKEKIYLRDFSKDIITRYPYRLIYTEKPREDDRNINEILNEYFKENSSISSKELEKEKTNSEAWVEFMPKYFYYYHLFRYKKFFK